MKRGRNQRRRQGANPNRALDSNGPDVRIRGTANQIYDKYQALARDASSSGDRVKAENYLQHAEHYFRVIRAMLPPGAPQTNQNADDEYDNDQPAIGDGRADNRDGNDGRDNRDSRDGRDHRGGGQDNGRQSRPAPDSGPGSGPASGEHSDRDGQQDDGNGRDSDQAAQSPASEGDQGNNDQRRPRRRRPPRRPQNEDSGETTDASSDEVTAS